MLEVELDIFSGMPNPKWILSETEEKELLDIITSDPTQISPVYTPEEEFGLGYRGLIVREINTDEGIWNRTNRSLENPLPMEFRVGSKPEKRVAADWLLQASEKKYSKLTDELREVVAEGVVLIRSDCPHPPITGGGGFEAGPHTLFVSNENQFNKPENILNNNCYAFASNHLGSTHRFAEPGIQGGRGRLRELTCGELRNGLYADGWTHHSSWPGASDVLVIAGVIWPGNDFHFYRLVGKGPYFNWSHKMGATGAGMYDNCGRLICQHCTVDNYILTPQSCVRGRYTDFCGYFYQNNATARVKAP